MKPTPQKPILTISLPPQIYKDLQELTFKLIALAEEHPPFIKIPQTKTAVASWLISEYVNKAYDDSTNQIGAIRSYRSK